jgi:uncharacterized DUF497 family protein
MFEWDDHKASLNITKHGVPFPFAARIFSDHKRIVAIDDRSDYGEIRYVCLGRIDTLVYLVVYTLRSENIRIISARKANSKEARYYENNRLHH